MQICSRISGLRRKAVDRRVPDARRRQETVHAHALEHPLGCARRRSSDRGRQSRVPCPNARRDRRGATGSCRPSRGRRGRAARRPAGACPRRSGRSEPAVSALWATTRARRSGRTAIVAEQLLGQVRLVEPGVCAPAEAGHLAGLEPERAAELAHGRHADAQEQRGQLVARALVDRRPRAAAGARARSARRGRVSWTCAAAALISRANRSPSRIRQKTLLTPSSRARSWTHSAKPVSGGPSDAAPKLPETVFSAGGWSRHSVRCRALERSAARP